MPTEHNSIEKIKEIFADYLEENDLRKTQERFIILEEIYNRNDHFDAESLYIHLKNKDFGISRATVYNTLELLIHSELVVKQEFDKNTAKYEKAHGFKQHDHIICIECKKVVEFCDPRIQQIQNMMGDMFNFKITHHSLNLYGICEDCQQERNATSPEQSPASSDKATVN